MGKAVKASNTRRSSSRKNNADGLRTIIITAIVLIIGGLSSLLKHSGLVDKIPILKAIFGGDGAVPSVTELAPNEKYVSDADTWVEFIDVGQGDCALVYSEGHYMLIDTGDRDESNTVINHLKAIGVEKLDYMILSHPHADHIGEAAEIYDSFEVGSVIMPLVPDEIAPDSVTYDMLLETVPYIEPAEDMSFRFGGCDFDTIAAREYSSDLNEWSVLVRLTYGNTSFMFTGDCGVHEEKDIIERGVTLSADVLKAGHHGSYTSSCKEWLEAVQPTYTVVSCAAQNSYGHPHDATMERLYEYSGEVFVTAEVGSVVFESDGENVTAVVHRKKR